MRFHAKTANAFSLTLALAASGSLAAPPAEFSARAALSQPLPSAAPDGSATADDSAPPAGSSTASPFSLPGWRRSSELLPPLPPTGGVGRFGESMVASADTLVIAAPWTVPAEGLVAGVYVYARGAAGWELQARLVPTAPTPDLHFGTALALSGNTLLVADTNDNAPSPGVSGRVYVYVRSGSAWTLQAELVSPQTGSDHSDDFGRAVALDGDRAIVGAPSGDLGAYPWLRGMAYVFVRSGETWDLEASLFASDGDVFHEFGFAVAVEGDVAAIGAPNAAFTHIGPYGEAYVFVRDGASWIEQQRLGPVYACNPFIAYFGERVTLWGEWLVVGEHSSYNPQSCPIGAEVFTGGGASWSYLQSLPSAGPIAFAPSGDALVIGGDLHSAHVFTRAGAGWRQADWFRATPLDPCCGQSVALVDDSVLVGVAGLGTAVGRGVVYEFHRFAKGDLDNDLRPDLVLRYTPTNENVAWLMDGLARQGDPIPLQATGGSAGQQVVGGDDFDGDGQNDLITWDELSGAAEVWLMNGSSVSQVAPLSETPLPPWRLVATADFTHDLNPDLVWHNDVTGAIAIWVMSGIDASYPISPVPDHAADANWEIVAARDYNGDCETDLLWRNSDSDMVVQWLLDSSARRVGGRFVSPPRPAHVNWQLVASTGAGVSLGEPANAPDLWWRNRASGRLVVWFLDGTGTRISGAFTSPPAPENDPLDWVVAAPR